MELLEHPNKVFCQMVDRLIVTPPHSELQISDTEVNGLLMAINRMAEELSPKRKTNKRRQATTTKKQKTMEETMEEKRQPEAQAAEPGSFGDLATAWCAAREKERGVIAVAYELESDNEGDITVNLCGDETFLATAAATCMCDLSPDNKAGAALRKAAVKSFKALGWISPATAPEDEQKTT